MGKIKILLADDHDGFRHVLATFLKTQERVESVDEAVDGQDAIEKVERIRPDLVLMDIHMPRQNGMDATRTIKNRWPSTKVFILSMDANEYYKRDTENYADGFIAKSSMKDAIISILSNGKKIQTDQIEVNKLAS